VRPEGNGRFEIIAGERRWRAAALAGLTHVPVIVKETTDRAALAMALIENMQREDLGALEQAAGLRRLIEEFKLTHEDAAKAIGVSRSAASNLLRLLSLAPAVQTLLNESRIDMGHARALLALDRARQIEIAHRVISRALSVRQTEQLVRDTLKGAASIRRRSHDRDLQNLEQELSDALSTTVSIKPGRKGSGQLLIRYANLEHLDTLLAKLRR
jgi:ParB family chromosome partitioning protein